MASIGKRLARGVTAVIDGIPGELGKLNTDGSYTVRVDGTLNDVYVRKFGDPLQTVTAIDMRSSRKPRLPVRIRKNLSNRWIVTGVDEMLAGEFLGESAPSANIPPLIGDAINLILNSDQFKPGRVRSLLGTDLQFIMEELPYPEMLLGGPSTIIDITSEVGTIASGKKAWIAFSVNPTTNTLTATNGTDVDLGTELLRSDAFSITVPAGDIPLFAYAFQEGDTTPPNRPIDTTDESFFVDLRPWLMLGGGGGSGTVTSVDVSTNASYLTSSGGPVTTSGTIALNKTTGLTANRVVATPNGSTGAADLRALVDADLPTALANHTITGGSINDTPIGQVTQRDGSFSDLYIFVGGVYGQITHSNDDNRVYLLPNTSDTFVLTDFSQILTNKTLTTPTIASFVNANHDHTNSAGGGTLPGTAIGSGTVAAARLGTMTGATNAAAGASGAAPQPASGDDVNLLSGAATFVNGVIRQFAQTADVTVGNTGSELTLIGSGQGSTTLAANAFRAGRSLRLLAYGLAQRTSGNFTLRIKLGGSTIIATATAGAPVGTGTNNPWMLDVTLTCRTAGASGTIIGQGMMWMGGTTTSISGSPLAMTAAATIDTTGTLAIDITAQWSATATTNTITLTNLIIDLE